MYKTVEVANVKIYRVNNSVISSHHLTLSQLVIDFNECLVTFHLHFKNINFMRLTTILDDLLDYKVQVGEMDDNQNRLLNVITKIKTRKSNHNILITR
jgi:hypothetical protein